ncbi:hypothetical protein FocnCong_v020520 [Fusarium oxysporum f. sp. conglutinans]|nr:hypothetical protein FocnCong_v020520 [Fusarium oxysporum f. sp. conglutinans]
MSAPPRTILVPLAGPAQRMVIPVGLSLLVQSLLILAMPGAPPQRAAQQLRACSAAPAPALAPRGEADEKTLEERKVAALEAIAEAARLWTQLNKPDEESVEEDEDGEDEDN